LPCLNPDHGHIINGHTPVKEIEGEDPIKANGKMIVIDGGFSKAYCLDRIFAFDFFYRCMAVDDMAVIRVEAEFLQDVSASYTTPTACSSSPINTLTPRLKC
jgi:fructose-1,6-bisphosphatase